jgi:hypothetical protein
MPICFELAVNRLDYLISSIGISIINAFKIAASLPGAADEEQL